MMCNMLDLQRILSTASSYDGVNFNLVNKIYKESYDRRFSIFVLACTCASGYQQTGIIEYGHKKYYYKQNCDKSVTLENYR